MVATALWLLSVLWLQIGINGTIAISALMGALVVVITFKGQLKTFAKPLGLTVLIASFAIPSFAQKGEVDKAEAEKLWVPFNEKRIEELVAEGKTVFVDVTAQWCLTCQVNKQLVLYQGDAYKMLSSPNVVAMKADWTNPDETIAAYLASFKRFAIPFNAVYGPKTPKGQALPEILSEDIVLEAIEKSQE